MQTQELYELLIVLYPEFEAEWESPENLWRDGGSFTPHGLCSAFSWFFEEQTLPLNDASDAAAVRLFAAIEAVVANDPHDKSAVANALCTCFLENIAQTPVGEASLVYMGPASREFFEYWHAE